MYLNVCALRVAYPALLVFDPCVALPVVFKHFGQGVKFEAAVRALVVFPALHMALCVSLHPVSRVAALSFTASVQQTKC